MADEINESQAKLLFGAANFDVHAFANIRPNETDNPETTATLNQQWSDVEQLIDMGLLEDVSAKYPQNIESIKEQAKRDVRIMDLTDVARKMFNNGVERAVN